MRIISVLTLLIIACTINAQVVSFEDAKNVANAFANARSAKQNTLTISQDKNFSVYYQNDIAYHVFNFEPSAYVVVSGDYRVHPILAYSTNSNYEQGKENPAFEWWMSRYKKQIQAVRESNITQCLANKQTWTNYMNGNIHQTKSTMEPLINTVWNQTTYYNEFCPTDPEGYDSKCVTGCVPTAIGQLMNYFRWPLSGEGSYTSEDTTYGTLSVNYANEHYNYNEFATTLKRSNPASSKLVADIGVSCDIHYSANASGMTNHKAAHCMKTYFKYVDSTNYIYRFVDNLRWDSTVIAHLDRKIPLYYAGWTDSNYVMGHAFLCDAYNSDSVNYFHFNWGWGGYLDGYFFMDDLTPGQNDFTILHELVINMYPEGEYPYYCNGTDTIRSLDGRIDDGSGPLFNYQNNTDCSWLIMPNDSIQKIKLNFLNINTEEGEDIITIYDGNSTDAPILGTYSGSTIPEEISSTGKAVFITFSSNSSNDNEGFLLGFSAIQETSLCEGLTNLTNESDSIDDGSNEYNYYANSSCRWRIKPNSGKPIIITFSEFDIDETDYLHIIDNGTNDTIASFNGSEIPQPIFVSSGKATLHFKTTATKNAGGFKCYYITSGESINETLSANWQIFPNPATDYIIINGIDNDANVDMFSTNGKLIGKYSFNNTDEKRINTEKLSNGIYYINVESEGNSKLFKIVK